MTSEGREKYDERWHLRQHELGACRCKRRVVSDAGRLAFETVQMAILTREEEIQRAMKEQAVAAPAPETSDVAVGISAEREAAPPAPPWFDFEAAVDSVLRAVEEATPEELEAARERPSEFTAAGQWERKLQQAMKGGTYGGKER